MRYIVKHIVLFLQHPSHLLSTIQKPLEALTLSAMEAGKGRSLIDKNQLWYYILQVSDWFRNPDLGQPEHGFLLEAGTDLRRGNDPT